MESFLILFQAEWVKRKSFGRAEERLIGLSFVDQR
jgi:hypothetical protein